MPRVNKDLLIFYRFYASRVNCLKALKYDISKVLLADM